MSPDDSTGDWQPPLSGDIYPVIEMSVFRERYGPQLLRPRAVQTQRVATALRQRLGTRSVLGVAFYPWHNQTTLWWFEQGMLSLLAATGWNTVWVTDARYAFDGQRLAEIDGRVSVVRYRGAEADWQPPSGHFDVVIALFPCDAAIRAARHFGAQLITFAIKNLHHDQPQLSETPPDGTPLWHAFAGSENFLAEAYGPKDLDHAGRLGRGAAAWRPQGAPFPTNRYYFPLRPAEPIYDALLFGSKSRDYHTAFAALARAGAGKVAALANPDDVDAVRAAAQQHGVEAMVSGPLSHVYLLELLEQTRLVLNPIMPPDESHYSLSVPLALGRPIVATDRPSVRPFAGDGVLLAPGGDPDAWAACITRLLAEVADGLPHRGALQQGQLRHDVDRFFGSAILATLGGG